MIKLYVQDLQDGGLILQEAEYIDDGWFIELQMDGMFYLYDIPMGGGRESLVGRYPTLISAIDESKKIT